MRLAKLEANIYQWAFVCEECGHVMFLIARQPYMGDVLLPQYCLLPNGEHPELGSSIVCSACGTQISDLIIDQHVISLATKVIELYPCNWPDGKRYWKVYYPPDINNLWLYLRRKPNPDYPYRQPEIPTTPSEVFLTSSTPFSWANSVERKPALTENYIV